MVVPILLAHMTELNAWYISATSSRLATALWQQWCLSPAPSGCCCWDYPSSISAGECEDEKQREGNLENLPHDIIYGASILGKFQRLHSPFCHQPAPPP